MKSKITKNTYYTITHPDLPNYSVVNYGDRDFILRYPNPRVTLPGIQGNIDGQERWKINQTNIHKMANYILEEEIKRLKLEEKPQVKLKSGFFGFFKK